MIKPEIKIIEDHKGSVIHWVLIDSDPKYKCITKERAEAIVDMMDALILCKEVLLLASIWDMDNLSDDRKRDFDKAETVINKALSKAGVFSESV